MSNKERERERAYVQVGWWLGQRAEAGRTRDGNFSMFSKKYYFSIIVFIQSYFVFVSGVNIMVRQSST